MAVEGIAVGGGSVALAGQTSSLGLRLAQLLLQIGRLRAGLAGTTLDLVQTPLQRVNLLLQVGHGGRQLLILRLHRAELALQPCVVGLELHALHLVCTQLLDLLLQILNLLQKLFPLLIVHTLCGDWREGEGGEMSAPNTCLRRTGETTPGEAPNTNLASGVATGLAALAQAVVLVLELLQGRGVAWIGAAQRGILLLQRRVLLVQQAEVVLQLAVGDAGGAGGLALALLRLLELLVLTLQRIDAVLLVVELVLQVNSPLRLLLQTRFQVLEILAGRRGIGALGCGARGNKIRCMDGALVFSLALPTAGLAGCCLGLERLLLAAAQLLLQRLDLVVKHLAALLGRLHAGAEAAVLPRQVLRLAHRLVVAVLHRVIGSLQHVQLLAQRSNLALGAGQLAVQLANLPRLVHRLLQLCVVVVHIFFRGRDQQSKVRYKIFSGKQRNRPAGGPWR